MKIPTSLKHKPVIVVEDYSNIDGRQAYDSDAKGLSWAWPSGMKGAGLTFRPRCGATRVNAGRANRRSCPCIGCWT